MNRKDFIIQLSILSAGACVSKGYAGSLLLDGEESAFAKHLKPVGRAMETEGYYVWCSSPIEGPDGKTHLFFSRWDSKKGMGGWINGSEICRAVADSPESQFQYVETIFKPRAGFFDSTTCHNPLIKFVDGKYCLFYMGNSNGKTNTKRIGLAFADSLNGHWKRPDAPLLEAGPAGAWDDHCTTNPAFIKHPNGQYWLYYKSWNTHDFETDTGPIKGNRKYGLAIADKLEGPYIKYKGNPIIDFSGKGNNTQLEDGFVWMEKDKFKMIARDMGFYNHEDGIIMESRNGINWNEPKIAYYEANHYIQQPPPPKYLKKYGRFERPQILFKNGKPAYLFTASQGGKYMTSSTFIFRIT
ncbi:glycoside hydrolase family protein [Mucilaginibacter arboris]|uniref:Glycosyl hydrolase family 43 n=1 Tax=Mucilaginibacter arboris TaxID=2682090 RepID=A0A7K1SXG1_9SPHI|nr:glycoside hydrolase family protein [Mucilaginibacter arboris]MVN22021.1 glycosyl hydrolase family 43 [Mucilaginibacter arboris]